MRCFLISLSCHATYMMFNLMHVFETYVFSSLSVMVDHPVLLIPRHAHSHARYEADLGRISVHAQGTVVHEKEKNQMKVDPVSSSSPLSIDVNMSPSPIIILQDHVTVDIQAMRLTCYESVGSGWKNWRRCTTVVIDTQVEPIRASLVQDVDFGLTVTMTRPQKVRYVVL